MALTITSGTILTENTTHTRAPIKFWQVTRKVKTRVELRELPSQQWGASLKIPALTTDTPTTNAGSIHDDHVSLDPYEPHHRPLVPWDGKPVFDPVAN